MVERSFLKDDSHFRACILTQEHFIVMHGTEMIGERFWHCCLQATTLKSTSPEPLYFEMNLQAFRGNEICQKSLFKFKACSFQLSVLYLKLASSDTFGSFLCENWEKSIRNLAFKHNKTGRDDSRWICAFRCSSWPTVWPSPNWPWSVLSQFASAIRTNAATDTGS